jgi:hypothetical protein
VSSSEYEEIAQGMEEAQAELERAALEEELPNKKRQTELEQARKKLADGLARLRELERSRKQNGELAGALAHIDKGTKQLLRAINANTKTTNDLLTISNTQLAQLEHDIVSGNGTAFEADPRVLAEGEFLKAQLGGIQSTEDPRPLFQDAVPPLIPGGFDVLSDAVCESCFSLGDDPTGGVE